MFYIKYTPGCYDNFVKVCQKKNVKSQKFSKIFYKVLRSCSSIDVYIFYVRI